MAIGVIKSSHQRIDSIKINAVLIVLNHHCLLFLYLGTNLTNTISNLRMFSAWLGAHKEIPGWYIMDTIRDNMMSRHTLEKVDPPMVLREDCKQFFKVPPSRPISRAGSVVASSPLSSVLPSSAVPSRLGKRQFEAQTPTPAGPSSKRARYSTPGFDNAGFEDHAIEDADSELGRASPDLGALFNDSSTLTNPRGSLIRPAISAKELLC